MQQLTFVIYDDKAKAYLPPFYLPTADMAIRTFSDCINDKQHAFGAHPEDYTLFTIGQFDNITGEQITTKPHVLGNGLIYKTPSATLEQGEQLDFIEQNKKLNQQFHKTDGAKTT